MSYASTIARTATAVQSPSGTTPFSTTGVARGLPHWPASSGGHQVAQGSGSGQAGSAGLDKELQLNMLLDKLQLDPLVDPDPPLPVKSLRRAATSPTTSTKAPNAASSPSDTSRRTAGRQPLFGPQGQPAGPRVATTTGTTRRPTRRPTTSSSTATSGTGPHGTNGAMKGQPPTIFDGERSKTNQFMTEIPTLVDESIMGQK